MTTPKPYLTEGGQRVHDAIMNALPPSAPARLDAAEHTLADHEHRLTALESPALQPGEDLS